ncbi:MAG: sodium:calcium antiporter, partial [Planctomycetes bacterium]|nr:sodium:calcium antiporter [Planctomycetota bacterium]
MASLALLIVGLAGLWLGTELAIGGTITVAKRSGISEQFLGLTVLAIGTDLPELVVAVDGALQQLRGVDASGIIVGNAIGSAITQA